MSWTSLEGISGEQVDTVTARSNVQMTIGSLPNELGLILPRALVKRPHAAQGKAFA